MEYEKKQNNKVQKILRKTTERLCNPFNYSVFVVRRHSASQTRNLSNFILKKYPSKGADALVIKSK